MNLELLVMNFLPDLVGAAVGAYLGYRYGIRQERQIRNEEEKELKKETIESLTEELDRNSMLLGEKMVMVINKRPSRRNPCDIQSLTTSSYESAVTSGRFSLLSPIDQLSLSEYFEDCKRIMNKVTIVESSYGISNRQIQVYIDQINEIGVPLSDFILEIRERITSD